MNCLYLSCLSLVWETVKATLILYSPLYSWCFFHPPLKCILKYFVACMCFQTSLVYSHLLLCYCCRQMHIHVWLSFLEVRHALSRAKLPWSATWISLRLANDQPTGLNEPSQPRSVRPWHLSDYRCVNKGCPLFMPLKLYVLLWYSIMY